MKNVLSMEIKKFKILQDHTYKKSKLFEYYKTNLLFVV